MAKKPAAPTYPVNPALEAAVIAHAEEDTPRLVYADWLDENGDPDRAAFIRTQVALWDKNPADEDYVDLIERQAELGNLNFLDRLAPLATPGVSFHSDSWIHDDYGFAYRRGFPFLARAPHEDDGIAVARQVRDRLTELFSTTTIRGFDFCNSPLCNHLDVVLGAPAVAPLSALFVDNNAIESDSPIPVVQSVVESPAAKSVRWFEIGYIEPSDMDLLCRPTTELRLRRFEAAFTARNSAQMKRLFASACFTSLHWLRVRISEEETPGTVGAIAGLPELHTLESFTFGPAEMKALSGAGPFRSLGRLMLSAPLRGPGAVALAKTKMPRLAELELSGTHQRSQEMRNEDVVTLASSPLFDNLRSLRLNVSVGDKAIAAITECESAHKLRRLMLSHSTLGERGLALIAKRFPALTSLQVTPRSDQPPLNVTRFLTALDCRSLRSLTLGFPVSDAVAEAIARNPSLTSLSSLAIGSHIYQDQTITGKGLAAILASKHLGNLVSLALNGERVDGAAESLCDPKVLPRARRVHVGVSSKMTEMIQQHRPGLRVG